LLINKLISEDQKKKINVNYNFLSKFVHPGIASIEVWENINRMSTPFSLTNQYSEDIYKELIFLYVSRLMYLYLKIFIVHFKAGTNSADYQKYKLLIEELDELSRDLWFFDNEPTDFDKQQSARMQRYRRNTDKKTQDDISYYDDPLRRLQNMRKHIL
jgi:hypothetical protein